MSERETKLAELLSEGLDLCVRGRKLDERVEQAAAAGGVDQLERPYGGVGTRCLTPALWVIDDYENALDSWEGRAKHALYSMGYAGGGLTPGADRA